MNEERIASLDALGFDWRLDYTGTREVMSVQSCHENVHLNTATTPDGKLLLESNSVHVTKNGAHQLDRFGTKCKSVGEKELETSLFQ